MLCAYGRVAALIGSHEVKPDRWPPPSGPKLTIEGLGTIPVGEDFLRFSQDERTKKVDEILASVKAETTWSLGSVGALGEIIPVGVGLR